MSPIILQEGQPAREFGFEKFSRSPEMLIFYLFFHLYLFDGTRMVQDGTREHLKDSQEIREMF